MSNKAIGIITVAILAIGGVYIYKQHAKKKKFTDATTAIQYIISSGKHSNAEALASLQDEFLIAWAQGIAANNPTFAFNGKNYNTLGGKNVS